jgi:hypothetical protein
MKQKSHLKSTNSISFANLCTNSRSSITKFAGIMRKNSTAFEPNCTPFGNPSPITLRSHPLALGLPLLAYRDPPQASLESHLVVVLLMISITGVIGREKETETEIGNRETETGNALLNEMYETETATVKKIETARQIIVTPSGSKLNANAIGTAIAD